jgi:hypothetical protein
MEPNSKIGWVVVAEVYNQDEAQLINGLFLMAAIPVKLERESAGDIYGLTIGPLAKMQILVPQDRVEDAEKILAGQVEETKDDEGPIE